jgi:polyferredoxin
MKIRTARRVSQLFFVVLLVWFCVAATLGDRFWQLRGWPVNWLLELDPLTGLATLLSTRTLYRGLLWGLATVALTIALGRVFCGWICPFGAMHQFVGWLGRRQRKAKLRVEANRYRPAQRLKYYILAVFLAAAAIAPLGSGTLQIGLLDPLPLVQRSVSLVVVPLADRLGALALSPLPRFYEGAGLIAFVFAGALALNLWVPRFYCRFVCPLGALLGLLGRFSLWRIGRTGEGCTGCLKCERNCEGACRPTGRIQISECVMCVNCLDDCAHGAIAYRTRPSAEGENPLPDLRRRGFILSAAAGLVGAPALRLGASTGPNWNPDLIRPPGALAEEDFLARCIKCGQCMRVCPTNVIHPAGLVGGLEGLWSPRLNFRIGTSGCQHSCIACGQFCPTAAMRPKSVEKRGGLRGFGTLGHNSIGTAFVDRGRCLPWAMDKPCIVCQENCPVSPKAIFTREVFTPVRAAGLLTVARVERNRIVLATETLAAERFGTGDYYALFPGGARLRIAANGPGWLETDPEPEGAAPAGGALTVQIRLQQPVVDPRHCIGCGVCEHECPVLGRRAIRVTAENESREPHHRMVL